MSDKVRVQLDFTKEAHADLVDLQRDIGAPTKAEAVRHALQALRWITDQLNSGADILVRDRGKPAERVVFPYIKGAPAEQKRTTRGSQRERERDVPGRSLEDTRGMRTY